MKKLYLCSIDIPTPHDLARLIGKPLSDVSVALITNAKDYYAERPRNFVVKQRTELFESFGMQVEAVDLRVYSDSEELKAILARHDLVWLMGGNTYMLRYELQRSGFEQIIGELLANGTVYGGDSAGALVAGASLSGINLEASDEPQFAEIVIDDGLGLVPYIVVPHADNAEFVDVMKTVNARPDQNKIIRLKDAQAVIFENDQFKIVEAG